MSLVIWNAHETQALPPEYDAAALVSHSGNVGTLALTNALMREGRPFLLTTGHWQESGVRAQIVEQLRSGAVATSLGRLHLGIIGEPFEGMLDISFDDDVLLHNSLHSTKQIPVSIVQETFAGISEETLSEEVSRTKGVFSCELLTDDALRSSVRLALSLENLSNPISWTAAR